MVRLLLGSIYAASGAFSQPYITAISHISVLAVQALHFKEFLIVMCFGYPSASKIFLVIFIDVACICCLHKDIPLSSLSFIISSFGHGIDLADHLAGLQ